MQSANHSRSVRETVNLSIDSDLLSAARELEIDLSATMEAALVGAVKRKRGECWLAENQAAIAMYNERVDTDVVFSDGLRGF